MTLYSRNKWTADTQSQPPLPEKNNPNSSKWLNWCFPVTLLIIIMVYIVPHFNDRPPLKPENISSVQLGLMLFSAPILFFIVLYPVILASAPHVTLLRKLKLNNVKWVYFRTAVFAAFAAYICCALINVASNLLMKQFDIKINPPLITLLAKECTNTGFLMILIAVIIVAPLVEEIVFRRIIFSWLNKHIPLWIAVTITAALFAAVHDSFAQFAALFLLGIGFQLIYLKYNSLIPSIIMHSCFNSIAALLLLFVRINLLPAQ